MISAKGIMCVKCGLEDAYAASPMRYIAFQDELKVECSYCSHAHYLKPFDQTPTTNANERPVTEEILNQVREIKTHNMGEPEKLEVLMSPIAFKDLQLEYEQYVGPEPFAQVFGMPIVLSLDETEPHLQVRSRKQEESDEDSDQ